MNKDEILSGSRVDNRGMDERERAIDTTAGRIASRVGLALCAVLMLLEYSLQGTINYGLWLILFSMSGTMSLVKYVKLRKKTELLTGIIQLLSVALLFILYVRSLIG